MPYIETKVSTKLSPEQEMALKEKFGKAIKNFPGKSESWLMLNFQDNCRLWFKGDNSAPTAFVEVKLFGSVGSSNAEKMTADICKILEDVLSIPQSRTYVKYEGVDCWGWNGSNF